jgi:hypothetical protein
MVVRKSQEKSELKGGEIRFSQRTLDVWRARSQRDLTYEDARQINENVVGFFRILVEWESKEKWFQGENLKKTS